MKQALGIALAVLALALTGAAPTPAPGQVTVVVFAGAEGAPAAGVDVSVGTARGRTNGHGVARVMAPPGTWGLRLDGGAVGAVDAGPVPVVSGEVTEVLVTVRAGAAGPEVSVEAAVVGPIRQAGASADATDDRPRVALVGRVVRGDGRGRGQPIAGVRVFVRGDGAEARTDAQGRFRLWVPAGAWDLTLMHTSYGTQAVQGALAGSEAAEAEVLVEMTSTVGQLDEFVVTAPRLEGGAFAMMDERRRSGAVSDIIGAEQMSKSGDGDAASALKRATGVTVVGGKFVYVRGLGERYSSTLLNGSTLPSPDPERRVVPLDMFPADILESVVIQKTYSPDMPGEFGGGVVQLRTRTSPSAFEASASTSLGMLLGTSLERGLMAETGPLDFLGIDGGFRALPDEVQRASERSPLLQRDMFSTRGYTAEELERLGELMPNRWALERGVVPPNFGVSGTVGDAVTLAGRKAGYLLSLTYDNDWAQRSSEATIFTVGTGGKLEPAHRYRFDELTHTYTLAGALSAALELAPGHDLRLTTLVDRISDDSPRIYEGFNRDVATDIRVTRLQWIERMLVSSQLSGRHRLGAAPAADDEDDDAPATQLDWRYALAVATRAEPDRRQVRYDHEPSTGAWSLSDRPEGNRRIFSDLTDVNHDLGLDLSLPLSTWWDGVQGTLKVGAAAMLKDRTVDTRRYKYMQQGDLARGELLLRGPEELFVPQYIDPEGFQLTEVTLETDNYFADHLVLAGYLMADVAVTDTLRVVVGARVEHSAQGVSTFEPFNPNAKPIRADLTTTDLLPALTASWTLAEGHILRAGVSRTVSRPDFRELSPATFNDVTGGRQLFGNPELDRTLISSADLRWEWYPTQGDTLSVGAFYKHFDHPIEVIVVPSAQLSVTYANAATAHNLGLEVEARKTLGFMGDVHEALADAYVAANAAWIASNVELPAGQTIQTSKSRPLQGQSPYVLNLQLGWDDPDAGASATVLYNVFGPRIVEVGALGAPDVYEEPVHQLDLVLSHKLAGGFRLSFKARNLLDPEVLQTQGPEVTERITRGRAFSLGLSKKF